VSQKKYFAKFVDPESSIFEYGCGMGYNINLMKNAIGYDISEYSLDFCRSKGIKVTNNVNSVENNSMDFVFSSHVLEHHPNPAEMLSEMFSKLKDDGKLILVLPHEIHGTADFKIDLNQHLFTWNFRTINNLLMYSGFKILKNEYLRGAGYEKLLPIYGLNKNLYQLMTNFTSRLFGIKEMMIIAEKDTAV
jgi:SAM-dependent methyltransferase